MVDLDHLGLCSPAEDQMAGIADWSFDRVCFEEDHPYSHSRCPMVPTLARPLFCTALSHQTRSIPEGTRDMYNTVYP